MNFTTYFPANIKKFQKIVRLFYQNIFKIIQMLSRCIIYLTLPQKRNLSNYVNLFQLFSYMLNNFRQKLFFFLCNNFLNKHTFAIALLHIICKFEYVLYLCVYFLSPLHLLVCYSCVYIFVLHVCLIFASTVI